MAYIQSITLSGGAIPLKGSNAATEYFVGSNVEQSTHLYSAITGATGLDTGNEKGMYRLLYEIAVRCVEEIAVTNATNITFNVYESDDDATYTLGASYTTTIAKLNKATRSMLSFPLASCTARYIKVGITLTGTSATSSDAITSGTILISVNPTSY